MSETGTGGEHEQLLSLTVGHLQKIHSQSWLPKIAGQSAFGDMVRGAEKNAAQVAWDQAIHYHAHGELCNDRCLLVRGHGKVERS